jgi:hypothetical protein
MNILTRRAASVLSLGLGIVACGLDLVGAPEGTGSSGGGSSGGMMASGGSSGMTMTSSGTVAGDASTLADAASSSSSSGAVEAGTSDPCDGKPSPSLEENRKCYWLSSPTTEAGQVAACAAGGSGVPFVPIAPAAGPTLPIPNDYFIPGRLMNTASLPAAWLHAVGQNGITMIDFGGVKYSSWPWKWSGGPTTWLDVDGRGGKCLKAQPTVGIIPKGAAVACSDAAVLPAVCQSN